MITTRRPGLGRRFAIAALAATAGGALGCWFDVPDLRGAAAGGGNGGGAASGGGSANTGGCNAPAPSFASAGESALPITLFAATDDGIVGYGRYSNTLTCGSTTLTAPDFTVDAGFVAHLDATGACTWVFDIRADSDGSTATIAAIDVDAAGAIVMTGSVFADNTIDGRQTPSNAWSSFVLKADASGSASAGHGWLTLPPQGPVSDGTSIAVAPNGTVLAAGTFSGPPWDTGAGTISGDAFVMALDPSSGAPKWAKGMNGYYGSFAITRVVGLPSGGVVVLGGGASPMASDFDGAPLKAHRSAFAAKLAPNGKQLWANTFGTDPTTARTTPLGGAVAANGDVFVTGTFQGTFVAKGISLDADGAVAFFVAVLDGDSGEVKFARKLGADSRYADHVPDVVFDSTGLHAWIAAGLADPIDAGCGLLEPAGGNDVFLAELAPDGTTLFAKLYGGGGDESAIGISRAPSGTLRIAGTFSGSPFPLVLGKTTLKNGPTFIAALGAP